MPSCFFDLCGAPRDLHSFPTRRSSDLAVHVAPKTTSVITSKSISKNGGRAGYRGLLEVAKGAKGSRSKVVRSEEHTSELQSHSDLVCRLLLEKKKSVGALCTRAAQRTV